MSSSSLRPRPKAIIFDLMGTCLDWHSSITPTLGKAMTEAAIKQGHEAPEDKDISNLALEWRQGFFDEIHARFEASEPPEDIDDTHRRVLRRLLGEPKWGSHANMSSEAEDKCIQVWHNQKAWPDVVSALPRLRRLFDVLVLANGTTRLQIDITKSSGLQFDMLLSSELLNMTKPDPKIYKKAISLLGLIPQECIMVAAHAYDLRAARKIGMRTVYLQRWTEDALENMDLVKAENDFFIDSRNATANAGGLLKLVEILRAAWEAFE